MAYRHVVVGNWLLVRWVGIASKDLDELLLVAHSLRKSTGKPLVYVGLQYNDDGDLAPELRKRLLPTAIELASLSAFYYIAICQTGVRASLTRTIIRTLVVGAKVAGRDTSKVRITDSLEAVLAEQAHDLPLPRERLLTRCREEGLLLEAG